MIHIFGSSGFLGSNLSKFFFKKKIKHKKFTSKKKIKNFLNYNKASFKLIKNEDTVIFLIAPTSVQKIENNKRFYLQFNNKVKKILRSINSKAYLIYISSDYVYSGKKNFYFDNAKSDPINFYGKLKVLMENEIKKKFSKFIILRSPKIFSNNLRDKTLYRDIFRNLKQKKMVKTFNDQKIQLLNIEDFLKIIFKIIQTKNNITGIYNIVGKTISRKIFAQLIAKKYNLDKRLILTSKLNTGIVKIPKKLILKTNLYKKLKFNFNFKL